MPIGALANAASIIVGGLLGTKFRRIMSERTTRAVMQVLGVFTAVLGLKMIFAGKEELLVLICLVLGALAGERIGIEDFVERMGKKADELAAGPKEGIAEGFVASSLLFCVGSMAIVGSLTEGTAGDARILLTKAVIDGIAAAAFASALGYGVIFSSIPVFLYQGGLTLSARFLRPVLSGSVISEVTAAGGFILVLLSLNILEIKKVRAANLLPALVFVAAAIWVKLRIG